MNRLYYKYLYILDPITLSPNLNKITFQCTMTVYSLSNDLAPEVTHNRMKCNKINVIENIIVNTAESTD